MSREKQIEEIYEVLVTDCGMPCPECDYEGDDLCVPHRKAEALYNAGYRKQKHGTWYHGTENGAVYAKCSACGRKMNYSCYGYAYCSLCGARMDGAKMKGADNE